VSGSAPAPGGSARQALAAGVGCYILWGFMPALFIAMGRAGATPCEILAQRVIWSAPLALVLVIVARQAAEVRAIFSRPKVLGWLALSAAMISTNWTVFVWAVNNRHNFEASLGYYINPLLNMAVGAALFRERIDRIGAAAIALAVVGVVLQAVALGHLPVISLAIAGAFCAYGVIRKRVDASAQAGLLVECLFLFPLGLGYAAWLHAHGGGLFGRAVASSLLLVTAGPMTVVPLALFAWAARRLPFSTVGFLQFIVPTLGFATGLETGEKLTPLTALSFVFIWIGALVFMFGAWRAGRRLRVAQVAADQSPA
jgi:chloramphenicol-sensitive protein RarD